MKRSTPKYMFLVNWVKDQVDQGELKCGDKLCSEHELCSIFGISRQTVRQAIGILQEEKYIVRRRGSGTFIIFDKSKNRTPTKKIGVISTYVGEYIFTNILSGIESVLTKNGFAMQVMFTHNHIENERRALNAMIEADVDGIIVEPTKSNLPNPNVAIYRRILDLNIPLIFFNAVYEKSPFPFVALDDVAAGRAVTDYLIKRGHKNIGGIFQCDDIQGRRRYQGFLDALAGADIEIDSRRIIWYATEDREDFIVYPERIMSRLRDCSAAVCYNDQIANMLEKICAESGVSVPNDLSIISVDNSDLAAMCEVPLTSIVNPSVLLGETAASNLLELIKNREFDANKLFAPVVVERNSVAAIGGSSQKNG